MRHNLRLARNHFTAIVSSRTSASCRFDRRNIQQIPCRQIRVAYRPHHALKCVVPELLCSLSAILEQNIPAVVRPYVDGDIVDLAEKSRLASAKVYVPLPNLRIQSMRTWLNDHEFANELNVQGRNFIAIIFLHEGCECLCPFHP